MTLVDRATSLANQSQLIVIMRAGLETLPRHQRHSDQRDNARVLDDEQVPASGTNIRADVPAFEKFLPADPFDKKLGGGSGIHKFDWRCQKTCHSASHSPRRQRGQLYTSSCKRHTRIFLTDARLSVAQPEYSGMQTKTCGSDTDLSARITFQFGPIYIPTKAEKTAKARARIIAPVTRNARQRNLFIVAVAPPTGSGDDAGEGTQRSRLHTPACARGKSTLQTDVFCNGGSSCVHHSAIPQRLPQKSKGNSDRALTRLSGQRNSGRPPRRFGPSKLPRISRPSPTQTNARQLVGCQASSSHPQFSLRRSSLK